MPFTTMNNYNWLFGMSKSFPGSYQSMPSPRLYTPNIHSNINTNYRPLMAREVLNSGEVPMPMQNGGFTEPQIAQVQWVSNGQGQTYSISLLGNSTTRSSPAFSLEDSPIPRSISGK